MRKTRWLQGALALAITLGGPSAFAADHIDGFDPGTDGDITDVYTWAQNDKLVLVMNVNAVAAADAKFSDALHYAFHLESAAMFGTAGTKKDVVCEFDATQTIQCWVGDPAGKVDDSVTGDASASAGITSSSGKVKVFAGLRADPFYFNLGGFLDTVATVKSAAPTLTFDGADCPQLDANTATLLIGMLQGTNMGMGAAENFFAPLNVLSIVMELDKSLVAGGGDTVSVWASTHMKGG